MLQSDPTGDDDELLPYLRAISISKSGVDTSHQFTMWIKPHEREKFRLKPNDVLISEGGDAGRAAHFNSDGEYYFQNAINRVRPLDSDQITSRYLFYWFTYLKLAGYVDLICNVATIAHFTAEKVKAAPFAFPPLETQKRIAAFLDEKTAQIDGLIARKQALLGRLAEKRQAIITQAVTKGLNPAAPLKDSGIDWLGQIPAHWEVKRLRFLSRLQNGINIGGEFFGTGYPFVSYSDVYQNYALPTNVIGLVESSVEDRSRYSVRRGDIFFTRTSETVEEIGIASTCLNDIEDASFAGFLIRARPWEGTLVPEFSKYYFRQTGIRSYLVKEMNLVTRASLGQTLLGDLPVLLPPDDEQAQIGLHVDVETEKLDKIFRSIDESLSALTEYRAALITSAVTGQIEGLQ